MLKLIKSYKTAIVLLYYIAKRIGNLTLKSQTLTVIVGVGSFPFMPIEKR